MRDGLDHVRTGDEHVAGAVHHEDEIGDGGRIDRAAGARSHDGRNLRHHAARQRVAQKDIGVAGERHHAFLNARAAGIVQADHRRAGLQRQVHDLADFLRVGLRERAAEHREILREHVDQAAVDAAVAGDEAVAGNRSALPCRNRGSGASPACPALRTCLRRAADRCARARRACLPGAGGRGAPLRRPARRRRGAGGVLRGDPSHHGTAVGQPFRPVMPGFRPACGGRKPAAAARKRRPTTARLSGCGFVAENQTHARDPRLGFL